MAKDAKMTFRVESDLHLEFAYAAFQEGRSAAQVLRELMRAYTVLSRERSDLRPVNDLIPAAERLRREAAVGFARASLRLEGFEPSLSALDLAHRFVRGEIELSEFVQTRSVLEPVAPR